ncbi:MAG: ATP synthase subunit I [Deltaproteobacteria bacterium]|nr:ATP synthase subunit I [Deltaproteobacteria bacterium]
MKESQKSALQRKIELGHWIILGISLLVSAVCLPHPFTLGLLIGGFISIANFYWLARDLKSLFLRFSEGVTPARAKYYILMKFYLRFIITGIVLYFVITRTPVSVIGLVVGLSIVVISIVLTIIIEQLINHIRRVRKKDASPVIS